MHLEPCIVSERVSVIDSRSAPAQSSASSLIIAVSVLGILIFVVLVPIIIIVGKLIRSRRTTVNLRNELTNMR